MGVFTSSGNKNTDLDMNSFIECAYEPGLEGAMAIVAESEQNYNAMMQAIGQDELKFLEENGVEMVYTEGTASGFFESAKKFFKNIWEKIKGLFNKFFAMFDSFVKTDKEFINKYQKQLVQVDTKDFKYKGFEYTLAWGVKDASGKLGVVESNPLTAIDTYKDETDIVEKWRGEAAGGSSPLTGSEFTKELYEKYRKGESSKQELDENMTATRFIQIVLGTKGGKKTAEDNFKELSRSIDISVKNITTLQKDSLSNLKGNEAEENGKKARGYSVIIKMMKEQLGILQVVNGAHLTAIKDENRQAKAILTKMLSYKPKNESTDLGGYGESRLSNVNFV